MEDLNKTQIILVCLLVSFVTSIGTGIITVSLLQEAPQSVTQTINRVVERTVEQVVPQNLKGPTIKEVTVVVKEEDLVIDAINKNSKSLVRILQNQPQGENTFIGIGLVLSKDGLILADKRNISAANSYSAIFSDGKTFPVKINTTSDKTNAVLLSVVKDDKTAYTFYPAVVAKSDVLQLGQTVIALGGKERNTVAIGRIIGLVGVSASSTTATSTSPISLIESDAIAKDTVSGTLLLNLNGEVAGLRLPETDQKEGLYVAIDVIKRANPSFFEIPKKNSP